MASSLYPSATRGPVNEEEARESLQSRLVVLSRLMFWSFIALLVGMLALYRTYPESEPKNNSTIYVVALIGLVLLVAIWRGLLVRGPQKLAVLHAIDAFYAVGTGTIFSASAYIARDLKLAETANVLWSCFIVFLRAIVIPSTGTRTAVVGAATFVPMVIAATAIGLATPQELPTPAFVSSVVVVSTVVVLLASIGSRIIYGLRRQVTEAMRLGQYTLDSKIGEGGNGAVYRAHHAMLRRPTAIKLIRPDKLDVETLDRFEREVQHMAQLTHPNTVAVFDYGRSFDGVFYYAMEYLDGIDLEKLVIELGPQPNDRVIAILVQVCGALQEAHHRGLIHRDIKPANIILCVRGEVPDVAKVVDFGLVKELAAGTTGTESARGILGTPAYLAPELVTDPGAVGPASDLYGLGAVGYFLVTARRVFEGKTELDVCLQHVTATPVPPSQMTTRHVSPALEQILLRCLAKRPADRPASAGELARLLREVPPCNDWNEALAATWWSTLRDREHPASSAPTLTITVDLGERVLPDLSTRPAGAE